MKQTKAALLASVVSAAVLAFALAPGVPATQPAKELTLDLGNNISMKLVLLPAGKFMMGSPDTEKDHERNEGPQHEVTISKPFYMGVYEVTQEQYEAVMGKNPSSFKGAQKPVETVFWNDAVEFCKKLSQKTGKTVSLPTEAQWEHACRAGSKTRFYYGNDNDHANLGDYAWYQKKYGEGETHAVGQKKSNAFGLYDMHGNVLEWCADWYDEHEEDYANADKTDPTGPAIGSGRVLRGGSWIHLPRYCRSASRFRYAPRRGRDDIDQKFHYFGFRVVVAPGL